MWNCVNQCRLCCREFEHSGLNRNVQYRRNIVKTGAKHLFEELVDWTTINISQDQPLPFCPTCVESIEKISSLSDDCDLIKNDLTTIVNKFTMHYLRNRKNVKSKRGIMPKAEIKIESQTTRKSNCVICYAIYSEVDSAEEMLSSQEMQNIWRTCKKYLLPAFMKNECNFDWNTLPSLNYEPFCITCSIRVNRVYKLNEKLKKAAGDMKKFVDSFSLDCIKQQKIKNAQDNEDTLTDCEENNRGYVNLAGSEDIKELIIPDVPPLPQISIVDFAKISDQSSFEYDTNSDQTGETRCTMDERSSLIFGSTGLFPQRGTNFTVENPISSDSLGAHSSSSVNKETHSEGRDSENQANGMSFFQERQTLASTNIQDTPSYFTRIDPLKNRQKPVHTCSSCKKVFIYKSRLSEHERNDSKCARFFKNVSDKSHTPTTRKVSHYPDQQTGKLKVDEGMKKSLRSRTPKTKCPCGESHTYDFQNHQRKNKSPATNFSRLSETTGKPKRVFNFKCTFCLEKFTTPQELSVHCQSHYDVALETRCEICTFVYVRKSLLLRHRRKHHPFLL